MRTSSQRKFRIALGFPSGIALSNRLQQGIAAHARECGGWTFTRLPEMLGTPLQWLRNWRGDGAFVFATSKAEERQALSLHIPVVSLSSHLAQPVLPTVSTDHAEMGRMAARHLLSKRFRHLAYYGTAGPHYSDLRRAGFEEAVKGEAKFKSLLVPLPTSSNFRWQNEENALDRWLQKLPRPAGVFACTDSRAMLVLEACERLGIAVPADIAVLGVDNDPIVCELSQPSLSSIARNDFEAGRQAAIMLKDLIEGRKRTGWQLVQPEGVIQRESTDTLAVEDPLVAQAVERIQGMLHKPFGADEIISSLPVSRRRFEARFRAALGCSPYSFINTLRVEKATALLEHPERQSLKEISLACGFASPRRFSLVFQRLTGTVPGAWRARRDKG